MGNNSPKNEEKAKQREEDLRRLEEFSLLDDTFARSFFRQSPKLAEFVLRIIMGKDDLVIDPNKYETQYEAKRLAGSRSVIMDIVGEDSQGRVYVPYYG